MMIEKNPSDLGHLVIDHLLPAALAVACVFAFILLMVRLTIRKGRGRSRGTAEVGGLNRQHRRRERAIRRRKRR